MRQLIPFVTGIVTIVAMLLAGNKDWRGWALGLANQLPWFASIVAFGMWGLLPLNVFMVAVYVRNLRKWRREQRLEAHLKSVDWDTAASIFSGIPVVLDEHVPPDTAYFLNRPDVMVLDPDTHKRLVEITNA